MENTQEKYERYRKVFAESRKITIEEATEYKLVKLYKEWLEEKYGAKINEEVE